jgi:dTDP-4-dehydrorhamnose reductase
MKVLIIGATGMLGHDLTDTFQDYKPWLYGRSDFDITSKQEVEKKLRALRPDLLINSAAHADVNKGEHDREEAMEINAEGPKRLAAECQNLGITLVHYSTDYVFSGEKAGGYSEADEPSPINVYGESKAMSEKYIQTSGLKNFYIIRTSWLFSKYEQSSKPRGTNFVNTIMAKARQGEPVKAVSDRKSNPTYTPDLAQATRQLVEEKFTPGIYHFVNEGCTSPYLMTREIFDMMKREGLVDVLPELTEVKDTGAGLGAPRPQYSCLLNTKFPKLRPWQQALDEYIRSL